MVYLIKEHEWKSILLILRDQENVYCVSELALRHFIEAVVYVARSGCQWRLVPSCYGVWNSVHKRFKRWQEKGIWERLFQSVQKDPDTEHVMVDATIIRAHACSAGYEKEGNCIVPGYAGVGWY